MDMVKASRPRIDKSNADNETQHVPANGYAMLVIGILLTLAALGILYVGIAQDNPLWLIPAGIVEVVSALFLGGLFVVNPNDSRVLILFGTYRGTVKQNGFWWANPLYVKRRITLRARNLNGQKLKVNDKNGNPIEIAAVVVWQVEDTYRAAFDVDDFEHYVVIQSEAAVRHLAGSYPYDSFDDDDADMLTLRAGADLVAGMLEQELGERFHRAGVRVIEARLSHLAYAPEIAEVMLRRQQAEAILAARKTMVQGAVSLVQMALAQLADSDLVELDPERKAAMVSNLMVVLSGDHTPTPVINTGTLYS